MRRFAIVAAFVLASSALGAQGHQHTPGMQNPAPALPKEGGQAAFTSIAEIVKMLDADPRTDWSKVNVEALRQHLIDMDEVTMRAAVRAENVEGGAAFVVTGTGRTLEAIQRMTHARAQTGDSTGGIRMTVSAVAGGVRFTAIASSASDARAVARIRGLGFIGVVALGDHHGPHHLGIANGSMAGMHGH